MAAGRALAQLVEGAFQTSPQLAPGGPGSGDRSHPPGVRRRIRAVRKAGVPSRPWQLDDRVLVGVIPPRAAVVVADWTALRPAAGRAGPSPGSLAPPSDVRVVSLAAALGVVRLGAVPR